MASTKLSKRAAKKGLTDKQRLFVVEYVKDFNAARAARDSGYKGKSDVIGAQLVKHPLVMKAIGAIQNSTIKKAVIDRDEIIARLRDNVFRDLTDLCDEEGIVHCKLTDIPKRAHAYIAGFEVYQNFDKEGDLVGQTIKIKLSSPDAAQDMAMKHVGAYAPVETKTTMGFDWDSLYGPPKEKVIDKVEYRIQNPTLEPPKEPDMTPEQILNDLIEKGE